MTELSIIIVNYNTFQLTCNCIQSILEQTSESKFEIIVVDNNSQECDPLKFKEFFPSVRVIVNSENQGFGRANNQGMEAAEGAFFLLLNSDTIIVNNAIDKSLIKLKSEPSNVGVLGCKQIDEYGDVYQSIFASSNSVFDFLLKTNPLFQFLIDLGKESDKEKLMKTQYVDGVSGAFVLLRRQVYNDVGGFDPDFFMYSEESEWFRNRIIKKYKVLFYSESKIIHFRGDVKRTSWILEQSTVSFALYWYKKGYLQYGFYLFGRSLNSILRILFVPLRSEKYRNSELQSVLVFFKYVKCYFFEILKFSNKFGSRELPLKIKIK